MNGQFQELLNELDKRLAVMQEKQEQRHKFNKQTLIRIEEFINNAPCKFHISTLNWLTWSVRGIFVVLLGLAFKVIFMK